MKKILLAATSAFVLATSANAATFIGTRTVGATTTNLSITTDDTLGTLAIGNILDYSIFLTDGANSFTFEFGTGRFFLEGSGLVASATELTFDFESNGLFAVTSDPNDFIYCLDGVSAGFTCNSNTPSEFVRVADVDTLSRQNGTQLLATVGGAVPEPATWAFMIFGFGAIGGALRSNGRRQRKANVKVSYA